MKNITKILTAVVLTSLGNLTYAQCDLSCTAVNEPFAGATIYSNMEHTVNYTRRNVAATPLSATAEVSMDVTVNGTTVASYNRTPATMAPGADETISGGGAIVWADLTPALTDGPFDLCVSTNVACDANAANDTTCITLIYSTTGFPHDMGVADNSVAVNNPTLTDGKIYSNKNNTLRELAFDLENKGAAQLPAGLRFDAFVTVKGTQYGPFNGVLGEDLAPTGTVTYTINAAANNVLFPANTEVGPFDICITIDEADPNDLNTANNSSCSSFEIVNVTGIEEAAADKLSQVYFNNASDVLNVTFSNQVRGNVELMITNTSGQIVKTISVTANGQAERINLAGVSNGLYMVSVQTANGEVETQKFVIN